MPRYYLVPRQKVPFHDDECLPFECGLGQRLPDGLLAGKCFHAEDESRGWQERKEALGIDFSRNGSRQSVRTPSGTIDLETDPENELHLKDAWNAHRLVTLTQENVLWSEVFK